MHLQHRQRTLLHGPPKHRAITCRTHTSELPVLKQLLHPINQVRHCPITPSISLQSRCVDLYGRHHLWFLHHMAKSHFHSCPQTLSQNLCHRKGAPTPRLEKRTIHQKHFSRHSHLQYACYDDPTPSFSGTEGLKSNGVPADGGVYRKSEH